MIPCRIFLPLDCTYFLFGSLFQWIIFEIKLLFKFLITVHMKTWLFILFLYELPWMSITNYPYLGLSKSQTSTQRWPKTEQRKRSPLVQSKKWMNKIYRCFKRCNALKVLLNECMRIIYNIIHKKVSDINFDSNFFFFCCKK